MRRSLAPFLAVVAATISTARASDSAPAASAETVCTVVAQAARRSDLPTAFFTRLIWRESRFRADALSPAGAQGVAQFMPGTAVDRGLANPFATRDALFESAAYLHDLRAMFGNLGLAAAGYNAGPGRVSRWLAGQAELPRETLDYVLAITGRDAADWRAPKPPSLDEEKDFSCERYVSEAGTRIVPAGAPPIQEVHKPWAVILVGNPQRAKVMAEYQIVRSQFPKVLGGVRPSVVHRRISGMVVPRYIVQVEADTRVGADTLCKRLQQAGGACFVLASR